MIPLLEFEFFRNALIAGILASVACGIMGTYVVVRKMSYISGGISHAAFGGIGLGYFLGFDPILGAILFSLSSAMGIGYIGMRGSRSIDTLIGALWASGMALGVLLIAWTPGYAPDLFSYLFGNILLVPFQDLILMGALILLIVGSILLWYNEFQAISFDDEYATICNLPVQILQLYLLSLVALTVVMLIRVVGVILVIALLTIPGAISRLFTSHLYTMMLGAIVIGALCTLAGMAASYTINAPSGATIILIAALAYGGAIGIDRIRSGSQGKVR
ncbi:MAG: metal ABC transporter permease [Methanomicrobiales archaeon]|nr:metal ABC transporter permease [Methanomicrobiales archaeon]